MDFEEIQQRALRVRELFNDFETGRNGRSWTRQEIALGFIGDIGDLAKLLLAEDGVRDIPNAKEKLAHEFSDCLWSLLVLADLYKVELQSSFLHTMDSLEEKLSAKA